MSTNLTSLASTPIRFHVPSQGRRWWQMMDSRVKGSTHYFRNEISLMILRYVCIWISMTVSNSTFLCARVMKTNAAPSYGLHCRSQTEEDGNIFNYSHYCCGSQALSELHRNITSWIHTWRVAWSEYHQTPWIWERRVIFSTFQRCQCLYRFSDPKMICLRSLLAVHVRFVYNGNREHLEIKYIVRYRHVRYGLHITVCTERRNIPCTSIFSSLA